jgi:hypothetical protein
MRSTDTKIWSEGNRPAYAEWLQQTAAMTSNSLSSFWGEATAALEDNDVEARDFYLSVILRTQGNRIEALKDALLCLQAQTDQAFEIILLVHNAEASAEAAVAVIVEEFRAHFGNRLSLENVRGGTRSAPLNVGLKKAAGSYFSIFDDDDLLFANWVERFHESAALSPHHLLRAQIFVQNVSPTVWPGGTSGFATESWPHPGYPTRFSMVDHLLVNRTPFMSVAFPIELVHAFHLSFNEDLLVVEDWDMILKGSLLLGVADIPFVTGIYRQWQRSENSLAIHSVAEWNASEAIVHDRSNSSYILLPPGSGERIRALLEREERTKNHSTAVLRLATFVRRNAGPAGRIARKLRSIARRFRS